jgi:hypothetical protein
MGLPANIGGTFCENSLPRVRDVPLQRYAIGEIERKRRRQELRF